MSTRGRRPTCTCFQAPIRCSQWLRGTGLRPVLDRLDPDAAAEFEGELAERLRAAYPPGPHGTLLPFRRIFAVGVKP